MFENFSFPERDKKIAGYHFPCRDAAYVMCLVHGIGEHAGRYERMAEALNDKGIAVISMDLRGHGISSGVRGDTAPRKEVLADIDALICRAEDFYPNLPVTLYGHSMGGNLCLDYMGRGAENDRISNYIISAPWIKLVMQVPAPLLPFIRGAAKIAPKMTISQRIDEKSLGNLQYVRPYTADPLVHSRISLRCAVDGFDIGNALYAGTHPDHGKAHGKPFLLMHGDADKICAADGSRHLAERLSGEKNFTYIEWKGYCHEIHNGGPDSTGDEVIDTIGKFIIKEGNLR